ncbi:hypothetical protein Q0M94_13580 [Deinococcus radiomollis]|uniref:hypothetical protein n=1 Tax=Deinococcus radiomollis TaxID=468916 RepID=UPI0038928CE5
MRQLRLEARAPNLGPLVLRYPLLYRAAPLGLFAYGLLMLGADLGHIRGECCTPSYRNYYPAIEFSSLWVTLVGLVVLHVYRRVTFAGSVVRVSWLGGLLTRSCPVERLALTKAESESRSGEKTLILTMKLGWLPVVLSSDLDGYGQLSLSLREIGESG